VNGVDHNGVIKRMKRRTGGVNERTALTTICVAVVRNSIKWPENEVETGIID
jgi:hypothetical protein